VCPASGAGGNEQRSGASPQVSPTPSGSPSEANPFPSPSPTPTLGPIGNGFVLAGYNGGYGSGGVIPSTTATPSPFPGSSATGFFVNIGARFSASFTAMLHFNDYSMHGGDLPVVTRSDGQFYYTPKGGAFGAGVGYASFQRSSNPAAANAVGVGVTLLPNFHHIVSPYATVFYYPSAVTLGTSAGLTTAQAGLIFKPRGASRILFQIGYDYTSYPNPNTSPSSLGGVQAGLGANF